MGITISCKKTGRSIDMGCGGFNRLRNKVAELAGGPFAEHYISLNPFGDEDYFKFALSVPAAFLTGLAVTVTAVCARFVS